MKKQSLYIISATLLGCVCMGLVDAVIQPGYVIKSAVKLVLFLSEVLLWGKLCDRRPLRDMLRPGRRGIVTAAALGGAVFAIIMGAYFALRNVFDLSALTGSLTASTGVDGDSFIPVALYITLVNSLLEEIFFRGFAFAGLRESAGRRVAYIFSAGAFALYHIAMMIGWFDLPLLLLTLVGLFVGGLIFDLLDERMGSIYPSWLVHMAANLAINAIGLMLFRA